MNLQNPDAIASALAGFSTVSFIVLFGIATFIPTIYESTILKKEAVQLLRFYPYRLISRLGDTWSIAILIITSMSLAVIGLLSLSYFLINNEILIKLAIGLSSIIVSILVLFILSVSVFAIPFKKQEIDKIVEYSQLEYSNKKRTNKKKTKQKLIKEL